MKQHIIIFHPALAPYRIDLFNSLYEAFDVSFYFEHRAPLEQSFDQGELDKRIQFPYSFLSPGLFGIKNLRMDVLKILKRDKPVAVFISEYTILGLLVLLYKICFNWKLKIVITCDDNLEMVQSANFVKRFVRSVLLRNVDLVLLVNDLVKDWYEKHLSLKAEYFYFPIIQSDELFRKRLQEAMPLSQQLKKQYSLEGKKVILYVGRLAKVKNVSLLLSAFKQVYEFHKKITLIIVGDGEELHFLEEQVGSFVKQGNVIFSGKKEGNELMAHYNLGDIFVLPSSYEPFGTVVNEALLSGCYVLCSSVAGANCLINEGKNGGLFSPDKESELINNLVYILSTYSNRRLNKMPFKYNDLSKSFMNKLMNILYHES